MQYAICYKHKPICIRREGGLLFKPWPCHICYKHVVFAKDQNVPHSFKYLFGKKQIVTKNEFIFFSFTERIMDIKVII